MEIYSHTSEVIKPNNVDGSSKVHPQSPKASDSLRLDKTGVKRPGYPVNSEVHQLMEAIDRRALSRIPGPSHQMGLNPIQKNMTQRPVTGCVSQGSVTGTSVAVTLKQALRRLCISQASEMAAVKRLSKPTSVTGACEAETIKKLYASVVVQASDYHPAREEITEILLEPEEVASDFLSQNTSSSVKACDVELFTEKDVSPPHGSILTVCSGPKTQVKDIIATVSRKLEAGPSSELIAAKREHKFKSSSSPSGIFLRSRKPIKTLRLLKPANRNKLREKKKAKLEQSSVHVTTGRSNGGNKGASVLSKNKLDFQKVAVSPALSNINSCTEVSSKNKNSSLNKPETINNATVCIDVTVKSLDGSRSGEKGECSQSSKSSIGECSCSTSISDDSHQNNHCGNGCRPHTSKDVRSVAIHQFVRKHGSLGLKNFKLLKKLGGGDIGTVYLAELIGSGCLFALKVMDIEFLISRKKVLRAQTEKDILEILDHPFLPTLYAHFTTDNLACLAIEYCPGGDLHVLRQKQPGRSFTEPEAKFYVAEVLLALEYLHMLGVIYRDLKPENILVREDGHIMLSDFDLSLRCSVSPALLSSSSLLSMHGSTRKHSGGGPCAENSCIEPLCLQPSWVPVSCFTPRSASSTSKFLMGAQNGRLPQLVAEPTEVRSNSFVGTHEYLAPEIIKGDGHGSAVDWWTFGIFLYELLFGRTPFKGSGNEETLANVLSNSLRFPENPAVSSHARDLIRALLSKEPEGRLGYFHGAAEIKRHPFFEGLNWALIRCATPPEVPGSGRTPASLLEKKEGKCQEISTINRENLVFQLF